MEGGVGGGGGRGGRGRHQLACVSMCPWAGEGGRHLESQAGAEAAGGCDGVLEDDVARGEGGEGGEPLLLDQAHHADAAAAGARRVADHGVLGAAAEEGPGAAVAGVGHEPRKVGPGAWSQADRPRTGGARWIHNQIARVVCDGDD